MISRTRPIAFFIVCCLSFSFVNKTAAQQSKGQVVIGGNAAVSLVGIVMHNAFDVIDNIQSFKTHITPGLSGTIDCGLSKRFSLGAVYFYQSASASWTFYTDSTSNVPASYTGDFHARITRTNVGARALLHLGNNENIDPYLGLRIGYSHWNISSNVPNLKVLGNFKKFVSMVWPQVLFGMHYYFNSFLGVNAEAALGFPYFMSAGISLRFGGIK
ncbi:MAG TPA: hypothetical protein VL651_10150 [Bacteroidia bacterium]|jgi:hypothetical protein|nr:hypothetical protein [Bacteroidia bacterium]